MHTGRPPPPLESRLRFLRASVDADELIETHMSWVILGRERVLKLKKAVRTPVLDFSTLGAREHDAREELRLNRRLAPGVYLGLRALQWDGRRLALVAEERLPAAGQTIDWLVLMRRLPSERMLDRMLLAGRATPAQIDALADRLAAFYRDAAPSPVDAGTHRQRLHDELAISRRVLAEPAFGFADAPALLDRLAAAWRRHAEELDGRVHARRIVDGHGDLRPEHACLVEPPVVIDCLEFNPALRQVDPFDELVYLGLECEMLGAAWVAPRLLARCSAALGDGPPPALLPLYAASRATLRARLAAAHLLEPAPRTPQRWQPLARRYLDRARGALDALDALSAATPHG